MQTFILWSGSDLGVCRCCVPIYALFSERKNQWRCSVCFKRYNVSSNITSYGSAVSDFIISNYIIVTVYCNLRKKKATLKISKNSRENICALLSFLIKLHTVDLQIYQKEILVQALVSKSMEWLLYDRHSRRERVKELQQTPHRYFLWIFGMLKYNYKFRTTSLQCNRTLLNRLYNKKKQIKI